MIASAFRYWNTVRYLRPVQIYGRVWFRLYRPRPDLRPAPPTRPPGGEWARPAERAPSFDPPGRFTFLNLTHEIASTGWDDPGHAKLWRYNLHYFDDLNAEGAGSRSSAHRALIERWIRENPPGSGTAWEPYPTSLRIVNWVKWALAGNALDAGWRDSLAAQARWLRGRLEVHLLGNHLFSNAKALAFAGVFFGGPEADSWLDSARTILEREIPEQFLADGGQFERSPMYHALALEDLIDLANLARAYPGILPPIVIDHSRITRALDWLDVMSHPDGEVSFFNDSAIGIAPSRSSLAAYAGRIGIAASSRDRDGVSLLGESGYARLENASAVLIADVGPVGPDYLPGHAHADTLSFELSIGGQRVFVNSGTSQYAVDALRLNERGTAAHNTVVIDGADSSEVWGGFRVARRARPFEVRITKSPLMVTAAHDGYRRLSGSPIHRRAFTLDTDALTVTDNVEGGFRSGEGFLHLHPSLTVAAATENRVEVRGSRLTLSIECHGGRLRVDRGYWSPQFGRREEAPVVRATMTGAAMRTEIVWTAT